VEFFVVQRRGGHGPSGPMVNTPMGGDVEPLLFKRTNAGPPSSQRRAGKCWLLCEDKHPELLPFSHILALHDMIHCTV